MPDVTIHDFRVLDRVLAETEPDAGDVVYIGARGRVAHPFVVIRRLTGPSGVYIDALDIIDADGQSLGTWEKRFEIGGESKPRELSSELRGVTFERPGTYTLQYSIFDDVVGNFPFSVVQQAAPAAGIVPGPLDAALSKSTIAWIEVPRAEVRRKKSLLGILAGRPDAKMPDYLARGEVPVWYGYENGLVYVLVGEGEQDVPGLAAAPIARLVARSKDKQSRVAEAECAVEILGKDGNWDSIARDLLLGRRLNLRDGDAAVERWKKTCEIVVLTPLPPPIEGEAAV